MANILLAITGLNPQVITETLFALHQQKIAVDEIHAITTRTGRDEINAHLLAPGAGHYERYLQDYAINPKAILFGSSHVHTLVDKRGNQMDDVSDEEENEIVLKMCLELTHHLTVKPENTVFFSIAGGRKTMSACLMVAAQMYGRPHDRIYHVLVSPEFENHRDFYYPPLKPVMLELHDARGQKMFKETSYARVTLVPIPFISMRSAIQDRKTGHVLTPAELFRYLVKEKPPSITVDLTQGKILFKDAELRMMPARLALYAFFILQKQQCRVIHPRCRNCADCYLDYQRISDGQQIITSFYRRLGGATEKKGICALEKEELRAYISKIRKDLQKAFGAQAAAQLAVESVGKKPDTRYGIPMDREKIKLIF